MITTYPDQPTGLTEDYSQRSPTVLAFTWIAPVFTGGDVIIDYRVSGAEQGGSFAVLAENVLDTKFTATGLTAGTNYEFKVEARNSYSHSSFSDVLSLLAAFKPEAPSAPSTETVDSQV
jgi:hypothetical protein